MKARYKMDSKKYNGRRGFSLIEMLTVIFIVVLLAGLITPSLGKARSLARVAKCKHNMREIGQLISLFELEEERWPASLDELYTTYGMPNKERDILSTCPEAKRLGLAGPHYIINAPNGISHISGTNHKFHVNSDFSIIDD